MSKLEGAESWMEESELGGGECELVRVRSVPSVAGARNPFTEGQVSVPQPRLLDSKDIDSLPNTERRRTRPVARCRACVPKDAAHPSAAYSSLGSDSLSVFRLYGNETDHLIAILVVRPLAAPLGLLHLSLPTFASSQHAVRSPPSIQRAPA